MRKWTTAVFSSALALAACSGSSTHPFETGTSTGTGGTASTTGPSGSTGALLVHGTLSDATTSMLLAGAEVCILGSSTCTQTSSAGAFSVSGVGSGFTASLASYVTTNWPLSTTSDESGGFVLRDGAHLSTLAQEAGTTFDTTTGALFVAAFDSNGNSLAGVSVTVTGSAGVVAYVQTDGTASATATSTSTQGVGYVFHLPPSAAVDVTFVHAGGGACSIWNHFGWPASQGGTLSAPIVAGQLTLVRASCQ